MRRLVLKMSMSLDGFVGGPNGEIDWLIRSSDEGAANWIVETLWQSGLHAMGSRTYYDMTAYWPTSTEVFAAPMNTIPKVVFTRQESLDLNTGRTTTALQNSNESRKLQGGAPMPDPAPSAVSWAAAQVANGDLAEEIRRLKAQDGKNILAHGGASFARSLVRLGLVDEYRLLVHPVVLGSGLPLFSELERPQDLRLISTSLFRSGVAAHVYRPC